MKRKLKYIVPFVAAFCLIVLAVLPASAGGDLSCDICIDTHSAPSAHCSYYCTGDESMQCSCGGNLINWCSSVHKYELKNTQKGENCLTKGISTYTCACGDVKTVQDGAVGDHQWNKGVPDTSVGKIYYTCTLCGETKEENIASGSESSSSNGSETNPDPSETSSGGSGGTVIDPSETSSGSSGGSTGDPTHTHTMETLTVNPGCLTQGYTVHYCTSCGYIYNDTFVAALGHNFVDGVCTRCGNSQVCTHEYIVTEIKPTCEEQGYMLHTCKKCGSSYKDDFTDALEHDLLTSYVLPTCTEFGSSSSYCQRDECAKDFGTYKIMPYGHNFINNVCTRCGLSNACDHVYVEKVYEPTCDSVGYTCYTCTVCGDAYFDHYTQQLSHVWKVENIVAPTCDNIGYKESFCTLCGEFDIETLNATGHKWNAVSSEIADDNTANVTYSCLVCRETKVENIPTAAAQAQNWLLTSIRGATEGLINMYETLANGIEVGGVTAGEVITGTLILACFIFMWFVLANARKK